MTEAAARTGFPRDNQNSPAVNLRDCMAEELVVFDAEVTSRKRLFERFSELIAIHCGDDDIEYDSIFETLHNRERLGCTALGKGIALPHGRISNLSEPVISVARLKHPIDYDAADNMPVWLAVCLLVPEDADDVHLNLLAELAGKFGEEKFVRDVKKSRNSESLFKVFTGA